MSLCYGYVKATCDCEEINQENIKRWCPYCRTPLPKSDEEYLIRVVEKRTKLNDPIAYLK